MLKTFKYRLMPSKSLEHRMLNSLEICRIVYNKTIEIRKNAWESEKKSISYFQTEKFLKPWKVKYPELKTVHSQVLQDVMIRVDLAYKAFFRRIKCGDNPGYPRFRGQNRYDSFNYRQSGFNIHFGDSTLYLSKIGRVPIILHRPCIGKMKNCTIRRSRTGKWYASIVLDVDAPKLIKKTGKIAGLDLGLMIYIQASDGFKIKRQRFFKQDEHDLARAQRKLEKFVKSSPSRERVKRVISHIHERIADRRNDFCHKTALRLVRRYDFIIVEDLSINKMLEEKKYSKSIADAAWAQLLQRLSCKAEEAGKMVVAIDPRGTSQMCSQCGQMVYKDISVRIHHCSHCGLKIDRDLNASLNILRLGMQSVEYRAFAAMQNLG